MASEPKTTSRRIFRHVDVWSVFKVAFLYFFVCGIIGLVSAVILWRVLNGFSFVGKVENLSGKLAGGSFKIRGSVLFQFFVIFDVLLMLGSTVGATLLAFLYNLISDVVGGIVVVEDEVVRRRDRKLLKAFVDKINRPTEGGDGKAGQTQRARPGTRVPVRTKPGPELDKAKSGNGAGRPATVTAVPGNGKLPAAPGKTGSGAGATRTTAAQAPVPTAGAGSPAPSDGKVPVPPKPPQPPASQSQRRNTASVAPVPPKPNG